MLSKKRTGTEWSLEEDQQLLHEIKSGCSIPNIAKIHKRTIGSIQTRLYHKRVQTLTRLDNASDTETACTLSDTDQIDTIILDRALLDSLDMKDNMSNESKEVFKINDPLEMESPLKINLYNIPLESHSSKINLSSPEMVRHEKNVLPYITIFDTETTGLPPKKAPVHDSKEWDACRILQIAWEKYTHDGKLVEKQCFLIKPTFPIPFEATAVNHITEEHAHEHGILHEEFIQRLCMLIEDTEIFVAHNASFDKNVISSELHRSEKGRRYIPKWNSATFDCTMLMGEYEFGERYTLEKLYRACSLPTMEHVVLHTADWDTALCATIYFYLRNKNSQHRRVNLNVDYSDKDVVKQLGGKFDWIQKKWYVHEGDRFFKYLVRWFV